MDFNLALELVRATEAGALGSARLMGRGDKHAADAAAVDLMRKALNSIEFAGTVVIGEGERDEAPMLYIGEKVGTGRGFETDLAIDPLECTNSVAKGWSNALSVLAAGPKGSLFGAPDTYMDKIAVGPEVGNRVSLDASVKDNIHAVADALDKDPSDVTVVILERPRHDKLVEEVRKVGARIQLITDGDVSGAIATCMNDSGIDLLLGVGAAPEGVISSAAVKCLGGFMQGRLSFRNESEKERALGMGVTDPEALLNIEDLAKGDNVMFAATGVTDGSWLEGVRFTSRGAETHSVVMRCSSGTIRFIKALHKFDKAPKY
ncbi:MAG: class II fructose-bisphosphatase [Candidatus Micrarchaeia archaeon]